jgi:hypothetical protein
MQMNLIRSLFIIALILISCGPLHAAYEGEEEGSYPEYEENPELRSGWLMGTDQGILFFVGEAGDFINPQYYGTLFGGYNIKGLFQPMIRLGQAIGSLSTDFNPTTFFFIFEGGFRLTPLRTKIRPFISGTAGFYVLSFDQFGSQVQNDTNFTFSTGGGIEGSFGRSSIFLSGAYRGFVNAGPFLQGIEITLGYAFRF